MHATSSAFLPSFPLGRGIPMPPNPTIITAGMQMLDMLIALLLIAVSVTADLAAAFDIPA